MSTPDPALPQSRQPMPVAPEVQEQVAEAGRATRRSVEEIERSINERTERLAGNVDEVVQRLRPSRLVRAGTGRGGAKLSSRRGGARAEVVGALAGAAVVTVFLLWRVRRRRS